ncbi:MAG: phosphatase PAP2 family protein [Chryseolinea sp.]
MEQIIDLDRELFLLLNGLYDAQLDQIMYLISGNLAWIPLYGFLIYYVVKSDKQNAWIVLLGIVLTILLSDQITSGFMKPLFMRLRPTWDSHLSSLVHVVNDYRGGKFGFPSSHAANTFSVTLLIFLVFRKNWMLFLFLWPLIVSYSRIYLGVHFPLDIFVGWMMGSLCAFSSFLIYKAVSKYIDNKKTPSY